MSLILVRMVHCYIQNVFFEELPVLKVVQWNTQYISVQQGSSWTFRTCIRVFRMVQWVIRNVCMYMLAFFVRSRWTFRELRTKCIYPCTCSQTGKVGHSVRVFVTCECSQIGIKLHSKMCICPCTCAQTGPVGQSGDIQNVCMYMHVYSEWSSETSRGSSERVYVHVRVLRLVQWDIQNEHMAGHYYEERLQNENITKSFYVRARNLDSETKLYLNEYQCITSGAQTEVGTRFF